MNSLNNFDNKAELEKLNEECIKAKNNLRNFIFWGIVLFSVGYFISSIFSSTEMTFVKSLSIVCILGSIFIFVFPVVYYWNRIDVLKVKISGYNLKEEKKKQMHRERMVDEKIGEEIYDHSTKTLKELGGVKDKLDDDMTFDDEAQQARAKIVKDSLVITSETKEKTDINDILVSSLPPQTGDFNSEGNLLRYKSGNGVEGIVVGKDYERIDKNKDGRILISEMYPLSEEEVLEKILAVDGNFSKTQFKSYVRTLFMLFQKAWSNNNYRALRALEADSLYFEHKARIEDLIADNCYDRRENIGIRGCLLKEFKVEGDKEILIVALTARMTRSFDGDVFKSKDWFENRFVKFDDNMGNVPYVMTFMRNKGVKTKTGVPLATSNCSNCGAVINVDDNGICTYCNTSLVSGEVDWVLVDIKNIELVEY